MKPSFSARFLPHLLALTFFVGLALITTWPLAANLTTALPSIPAERGQDVWQNAWNFWWTRQALLVEHTNPYRTQALFYPLGASLYLHSLNLPQSLFGLLLLPTVGLVASYNLVTLLVIVLAGYAVFLLARGLSGSAPAGLLAGTIALCSPQRLDELRQSQLPTLSDYAVPLALLLALLAVERRSWRLALATGALVLLAGLSSWYHLFHLLLVFAFLMLWQTVAAWRAQGTTAGRTTGFAWLQIAGITALVCAPLLLPATLEAATAAYAVKSETLVFSADLLGLLPRSFGGVWQAVPPDWVSDLSFGWLPLLLALVGLALDPQRGRMWVALAGVCVLLSLGPHLLIGGVDTGILLPYELLRVLPVIDSLRAPTRLNYIATMLLGLLAAFGAARLLRRVPLAAAWAACVLLALLVAAETLRLPFPLRTGLVSPFYTQVAAEPGEWTILELPIDRPDRSMQEMYAQGFHGKPILPGHLSREVPRLPYESAPPIAQAELATDGRDIVAMTAGERDQLLRGLRVRYLLVRYDPRRPERLEQQVAAARAAFGALSEVYADAELRAYRLDALAAWLDGPGRDERVEPPLFLGLDERWKALEEGRFGLGRWLPARGAGMWAYSQHPRTVSLELLLYSLPGARPLELWINGSLAQTLPIPAGLDPKRYLSGPIALPAGSSLIELRAPEPGASAAQLGLGNDQRVLTFSIHHAALHELAP